MKDISKSFDGRPILKKISIEMHPGEIVGLLGPNGSGKSTLYSIIIGQHMADKGKIIIGNKDISEIPIHERTKLGLGYLSQQRSVFNMSVYDNLLGITQNAIKNTEEQRRVTEKLLDEFNLQHLRTLNSNVLKMHSYGCSILITDHQVKNLFVIVDRAYVLGEQSIIAEGTPNEILKSSKAIQLYFGNQYSSN